MKKVYTLIKKNAGVHVGRMASIGACLGILGCTQQCQTNPVPEPKILKSSAQSALPTTETAATRTLVFLGDSLTAGYELAASESFPAQVEKTLREKGYAWKVVNAGISGDTSAGALARLDWVMRAKPDVLFVCLGANDGLRGLKLSDTEKNLREILQRATKVTAKVALAGMLIPSNYGPDYTQKFASLFPRLAEELGLPFLPFLIERVALVPEFTLADGIHPNALGARKVADKVLPFVEPLLKEVEQSQGPASSERN